MKLPWNRKSITEKFKGFWASPGTTEAKPHKFNPGQYNWKERCNHYDVLLAENSMAKSCAWGLAGRVLQNGLFLEPLDKYDRAMEARDRCEELNERIGMRSLLYNTIALWATHGSYFWEKTDTPTFDVKAVPQQELIEPVEADETGEVSMWGYGMFSQQKVRWSRDEIIHFNWMPTSQSYPYGTSLFTGCETELGILEQLESDIKEHMHRTAFPQTAIGAGDQNFHPIDSDIEDIRNSIRNWKPGEIQVTNYPLTKVEINGGQPIRDLEAVLSFCKDNITDAFMVSPISKLYNSTYASSVEMQDMENARLITPMQTLLAHVLETELYQPYLEWLGFSVKVCPKVKWVTGESNRAKAGAYWQGQVGADIVPAEYAAEQQGFDLEKIAEMKQREIKLQLETQMMMQAFAPKPEEKEDSEGEKQPAKAPQVRKNHEGK
jgi:hypothetical protein